MLYPLPLVLQRIYERLINSNLQYQRGRRTHSARTREAKQPESQDRNILIELLPYTQKVHVTTYSGARHEVGWTSQQRNRTTDEWQVTPRRRDRRRKETPWNGRKKSGPDDITNSEALDTNCYVTTQNAMSWTRLMDTTPPLDGTPCRNTTEWRGNDSQ